MGEYCPFVTCVYLALPRDNVQSVFSDGRGLPLFVKSGTKNF